MFTIWLGGPVPPGGQGSARGSEFPQKWLKMKDSSVWMSSPEMIKAHLPLNTSSRSLQTDTTFKEGILKGFPHCSHSRVWHQIPEKRTSLQGAWATWRDQNDSLLSKLCHDQPRGPEQCDWPARKFVFAALPSRADFSSQLAVYGPGWGRKVWEERALPFGATWRHTKQESMTLSTFLLHRLWLRLTRFRQLERTRLPTFLLRFKHYIPLLKWTRHQSHLLLCPKSKSTCYWLNARPSALPLKKNQSGGERAEQSPG